MIAIGGLALSRGLTLEGLTVSYIIRNASASDTLMQMARWFGYRDGYEDICRLYLPEPSFDHYDQIHIAIEELAGEIRLMEELGQTPEDFGLKVRQSPTGIRITAANKMRSASEFKLAQDYSGRHIEGHAIFNDKSLNTEHRKLVRNFMLDLGEPEVKGGGVFWSNVPGRPVTALIRNFSFPPIVTELTRITSDHSLLDDYMSDRVARELANWDVYVPGPKSGDRTDEGMFLGSRPLKLRLRRQGRLQQRSFRFYGSKNRVADPADAAFLLSEEQKMMARKLAAERNIKGDRKFCLVRERPLLILHLLSLGDEQKDGVVLADPVVTLSVCLPKTNLTPVERTYQVNRIYREAQLSAARDESDDDEDFLADD